MVWKVRGFVIGRLVLTGLHRLLVKQRDTNQHPLHLDKYLRSMEQGFILLQLSFGQTGKGFFLWRSPTKEKCSGYDVIDFPVLTPQSTIEGETNELCSS